MEAPSATMGVGIFEDRRLRTVSKESCLVGWNDGLDATRYRYRGHQWEIQTKRSTTATFARLSTYCHSSRVTAGSLAGSAHTLSITPSSDISQIQSHNFQTEPNPVLLQTSRWRLHLLSYQRIDSSGRLPQQTSN